MTIEKPDPAKTFTDHAPKDTIIASVFRAALIVLMLMGLPLVGWLIYLNLNKNREAAPNQTPAPVEAADIDGVQ